MTEAALDPGLPIVDPHHHLWDFRDVLGVMPPIEHPFYEMMARSAHYMPEHLVADTADGHNVIATVFVECGAFYRTEGPDAFKPVGEVEFASRVAADGARGAYGELKACSAIVGHANLAGGDDVQSVLEAEIAAGEGRLRGIRHMGAHDPDPGVMGPLAMMSPTPPDLFGSDAFRKGFACLDELGLSFDAWVLEPQIPMVTDLARAFPRTPIVLDHAGTPLGIAGYDGRLGERFDVWRASIRELAGCPNVSIKVGGLAMPFSALPGDGYGVRHGSETLAELWRPYIETCIDAFGAERSMFESNFPVDSWGADYGVIWNSFKRVTHGASASEKEKLFAGTAASFYRIGSLASAPD